MKNNTVDLTREMRKLFSIIILVLYYEHNHLMFSLNSLKSYKYIYKSD